MRVYRALNLEVLEHLYSRICHRFDGAAQQRKLGATHAGTVSRSLRRECEHRQTTTKSKKRTLIWSATLRPLLRAPS
jgi:hypothetical protein